MEAVDIDQLFDFFPTIASLLKDITTPDENDGNPKRARDVTKHFRELQTKFSKAEEYLDNLPGGYLSKSEQLREQKNLEKTLDKKRKFLETCLDDFKKQSVEK